MTHQQQEGKGTSAVDAPADLVFSEAPHPNAPAYQGVFLQNTNSIRGIVAQIQVNAGNALRIERPTRASSKPMWPRQFEVRLNPGELIVIGFTSFPVWISLPLVGAPDIQDVAQTYSVVGAAYHPLPLPIANENVLDFVWVYSAPITGNPTLKWADVIVSTHPNKPIEGVARFFPDSALDGQGLSIAPGYYQQIDSAMDQQTISFPTLKFA